MAKESISKRHITQSNVQDGGGIVIEDMQWNASGNERSILTNAQRTIEDMLDLGPQSRVRWGLGISSGAGTSFDISSGAALVNGRWWFTSGTTNILVTDLYQETTVAGERIVGIYVNEAADSITDSVGNIRDESGEVFYVWESGSDAEIPDNVLPIALITRDAASGVSAVTNLHSDDYPEVRANEWISLNEESMRVKDYKGKVLLTMTSGTITVPDNLTVTKIGTIDDLVVGGSGTIAETLDVTGLTTVDDLVIGGSGTIAETLDITGLTTVDDIVIGGSGTIAETLDVTGLTTVDDLVIGGSGTVTETLDVTGKTTVHDVDITGSGTVAETLDVTGALSVTGQVNFAGGTTYYVDNAGDANLKDVTVNDLTVTETRKRTHTFENYLNATGDTANFDWDDATYHNHLAESWSQGTHENIIYLPINISEGCSQLDLRGKCITIGWYNELTETWLGSQSITMTLQYRDSSPTLGSWTSCGSDTHNCEACDADETLTEYWTLEVAVTPVVSSTRQYRVKIEANTVNVGNTSSIALYSITENYDW